MRKQRKNTRWLFPVVGGFYLMAMLSEGDISSPGWINDEGVISVQYRFETGDTEPAPSASANLVDTPSMLIDKVTDASAGWIDPEHPSATLLTRMNNTGVWEIGEDGYMHIVLPVLGNGAFPATVDFFVEVISAQGVVTLPDVSVDGTLDYSYLQEVIEPDPLGMYNWVQQVSTGRVDFTTGTDLSIAVTCLDTTSYGDSSAIDQVTVYARVVPEPAVITLIVLAGGAILGIRRVFSAGV